MHRTIDERATYTTAVEPFSPRDGAIVQFLADKLYTSDYVRVGKARAASLARDLLAALDDSDWEVVPRPNTWLQQCRVCGCTDEDCTRCVERTGDACHWVEDDLCSACATWEPSERMVVAVATELLADVEKAPLGDVIWERTGPKTRTTYSRRARRMLSVAHRVWLDETAAAGAEGV